MSQRLLRHTHRQCTMKQPRTVLRLCTWRMTVLCRLMFRGRPVRLCRCSNAARSHSIEPPCAPHNSAPWRPTAHGQQPPHAIRDRRFATGVQFAHDVDDVDGPHQSPEQLRVVLRASVGDAGWAKDVRELHAVSRAASLPLAPHAARGASGRSGMRSCRVGRPLRVPSATQASELQGALLLGGGARTRTLRRACNRKRLRRGRRLHFPL